jgi:hypothetical protein
MAHFLEPHFRRAIQNVVAYGDTDIFPYPFENTLFNQREDDVVNLLTKMHDPKSGSWRRWRSAERRRILEG